MIFVFAILRIYRYKKFCLLSLKTQKYIPTDAFLQT